MINFVSGFLVAVVYVIVSIRELFKRKQIKNAYILAGASMMIFLLMSFIICIIPTWRNHSIDEYTSEFWVGVETVGERRIDFVREKILNKANLFGEANLSGNSLKDEQGYMNSIENYFGINSIYAFLGILSKYGWVASIAFIGILLLFYIKLIITATKIKEKYGNLIIIGITSLFILQTVCNLAMNIGLFGVAEFDLPIISGGQSTFIVNLLCMSLILSIYRRKDINFEEPRKSMLFVKFEKFLFDRINIMKV